MLLRGISRKISTFTTYYDILGIPPNSNEEAIKTAYRNLAKKYHPDVSSEHENMFRLINEAYHILSNLKVRAQYDKTKQQMTQEEVSRILKQERGKSGLPVGPQEARTEYAQKRLQELAEERKKFNVDTFNKFRGGIPIKDGRTKRANIHGGEGLEGPGSRANPGMIDFLQERDSHMAPWNQKVGSVEVKQFNLSKIRDQNQTATKVKQWLPLEIDTTYHHMKNFIRFWAYWGTLISIPIVLYLRSEFKKAQNRSKIGVLREQASKEGVQLAGMAPAYFK